MGSYLRSSSSMGPVGHDLQVQRSQGPNILNGNYGHLWYHWKDIFNGNRMALMILTCDLFQGHRDLKGQKRVKNDIWYHWKDIFKGNRMALMILTCDLFQGHRDLKGQKWYRITGQLRYLVTSVTMVYFYIVFVSYLLYLCLLLSL